MSISLLDSFTQAFSNKNISIVEFAESEDYCGKPLYPRQRVLLKLIFLEEMTGYEEDVLSEWIKSSTIGGEVRICSRVRERRQELIDQEYKHFREVILVGGRRSSKGYMTALSIAKKMHDLIKMENPQRRYGIDPDKQIYATIIAASLDQAKAYQYADTIGAIQSCKAFDNYLNKVLEEEASLYTPADFTKAERLSKTRAKIERDFSSIRTKPRAANAGTIRGEATFVAVLDEMAHMLEGVNSRSSAEKIYKALTPALDQFGKDAFLFLNSSPYTKIGKFYDQYKIGMPESDEGELLDKVIDPRTLVFRFPSWELYKDWERDPERRFIKAIVVSPDAIPTPEMTFAQAHETEREAESMRLEEEKDPETFKVERRAFFAEVEDSFLNPAKVDVMFSGMWDGREIKTNFKREFGPDVSYKGHGDPATTTANFGLALGHTEWGEDRAGNPVPHVVFDHIHAWKPAEADDHTLNYLEIQDEIVDLLYVFRPEEFTFDQFESHGLMNYLRNQLRERRASEVRIAKKTATEKYNRERAYLFKQALNLGLVHAPPDSPFAELAKNELKFLQEKNGRVDRQKIGPVTTKDVADCIMEVVYYLLADHIKLTFPSMEGTAAGGYPIREGRLTDGNAQGALEELHSRSNRIMKTYRQNAPPSRGGRLRPGRGAVGGSRRIR